MADTDIPLSFMLTALVTQRIVLHKRITPYDATTHYFQKTRVSMFSYNDGDTIYHLF